MKMFRHFGSNLVHFVSPHLNRIICPKQLHLRGAPIFRIAFYSLSGDILTHSFSNFSKTPVMVRRKPSYSSSNIPLRSSKFISTKGLRIASPVLDFDKNDKRFFSTVVWLLAKPLAKITAIIVGRIIGNRFWALAPEERQQILFSFRDNAFLHSLILGALFILVCLYYIYHLEETPITHRQVFISFSKENVAEIAQFQTNVLVGLFQEHFLPGKDHRVKRTINVAERIIKANPATETISQTWTIYIINEPLVNAFVLPNGHIFVFSGSLDISDTDDQLAIILGHEMAHAVLNHGVEGLSRGSFVDWFLIVGFLVTWCVIPYSILACITTYVLDKVVDLLVHMPASRQQEWEADHVGLIFAANACYDVREAGVLWRKIAKEQEERRTATSLPVWMGTHPDSAKRAEFLDSLLADAEGWRKANGCPPLQDKNSHSKS